MGEVKKVRGRKNSLSAAGLRSLRDEYARSIELAQRLTADALTIDRRASEASSVMRAERATDCTWAPPCSARPSSVNLVATRFMP